MTDEIAKPSNLSQSVSYRSNHGNHQSTDVFFKGGCCFTGLDVYEDEPDMKPGLADLPNAVIVPHIASASMWTRSGMVSSHL